MPSDGKIQAYSHKKNVLQPVLSNPLCVEKRLSRMFALLLLASVQELRVVVAFLGTKAMICGRCGCWLWSVGEKMPIL